MPKKPESKLWDKIRKALVEHGGLDLYFFKMHGGPHSVPGVPDCIGCYRGFFFGLEVKVPERASKLTEKQAHHLKMIRRAGGYSAVVTSPEEAVAVLKKIDKYWRGFGTQGEASQTNEEDSAPHSGRAERARGRKSQHQGRARAA